MHYILQNYKDKDIIKKIYFIFFILKNKIHCSLGRISHMCLCAKSKYR